MSLLEELLAPIEDGAPAGPDLRGSNEFAAIERAFMDADQPALMTPGGAAQEPGEEYEEVVGLCTDFLRDQSKDLKVAVFLAASLLRAEGFSGLATGLGVIKGLLDRFWDDLHPAIPSRAPILDWFGSDDLSYALYLVPLTEFGHRHSDYKSWVKEDAATKPGPPKTGAQKAAEEDDGQGFGSAFGQTPREWYEELVTSLHRCTATLEELDSLGKERFPKADEKPPRYASLADALKRMTAAAEDLLDRKPAPPKPKEPAVPVAEAPPPGVGEDVDSGAPVPRGEAGTANVPAPISAEPKTTDEAAALVAVAARAMRREQPWNPSPYLLLRGLRWGELRAAGDPVDPRILEAPSTPQRTRLKSLFLDKKWPELLEASEEIMATPAGRGWLDLQRYTIQAAARQGPDYQHATEAIRSLLHSLLEDFPSLPQASLMDDSPTASRDTMAWLREEGLLPSEGSAGAQAEVDQARRADRIVREAGFDRALAMARAGDPQGAVEMLMERAEHERSQRARFITKSEAAGIMVSHGMTPVARPILDELLTLVEQHQLEAWEPADVVAKPMGLLLQCLDAREAPLRQKIYPRLAKLDPMLAMRVGQSGSAGGPGTAASPPAPPQPGQPQGQPPGSAAQPPPSDGGGAPNA